MTESMTLVNPENIEKKSENSWEKLALVTINGCPKIKKEREKLILIERFGIGKSPKTLNSIGKNYDVTRERIRQIVNNAIRKIRKFGKSKEIEKALLEIENFITKNGGYATCDFLEDTFAGAIKAERNSFRFITALSENLEQVKESNVLREGWSLKNLKQNKFKEIGRNAAAYLKKCGETKKISEIAKELGEDEKMLESILSGTKAVMKSDEGNWGLTSWPHVNPKSIRDKSKYILKRHAKPIHYTELTIMISEMGLKDVTKQSVHNELIKNEDFVLVGRGIYALTEWGYKAGVVEEVIVEILMEADGPLHKNEIIDRVLEKRIVKASTVILNLQKKRFKRVGKATYTLN